MRGTGPHPPVERHSPALAGPGEFAPSSDLYWLPAFWAEICPFAAVTAAVT